MKNIRSRFQPALRAGFTLIELVVVVVILAILAAVAVPRFTARLATARDARRLADVKSIQKAIDQYYIDRGAYPAASAAVGGWDVSNDAAFITSLTQAGYLAEVPSDPINNATYNYRYFVYPAGSYGCVGAQPFYVIGLTNFETAAYVTKYPGYCRCTGRNWNAEFDYVTGGGASFN
jgi:type II secretion system protein G